jgi:hypothetical protein
VWYHVGRAARAVSFAMRKFLTCENGHNRACPPAKKFQQQIGKNIKVLYLNFVL